MKKPEFCIRCGVKNDGRTPFIGYLCLKCFLESKNLLCIPRELHIPVCRSCFSVRLGHKWEPASGFHDIVERIARKILEKPKICQESAVKDYKLVEVEPVTKPSWQTLIEAKYSIIVKGLDDPIELSYLVKVRLTPTLCPMCKNSRGGEYNALVQIRGLSQEDIEDLLSLDTHIAASIVDIIPRKNGIDIYLLERGAANKLVRDLSKRYRLAVKRSKEDVGITSQGKFRRRLVYSLRINEGKEK